MYRNDYSAVDNAIIVIMITVSFTGKYFDRTQHCICLVYNFIQSNINRIPHPPTQHCAAAQNQSEGAGTHRMTGLALPRDPTINIQCKSSSLPIMQFYNQTLPKTKDNSKVDTDAKSIQYNMKLFQISTSLRLDKLKQTGQQPKSA